MNRKLPLSMTARKPRMRRNHLCQQPREYPPLLENGFLFALSYSTYHSIERLLFISGPLLEEQKGSYLSMVLMELRRMRDIDTKIKPFLN
jgi:hypothetical protein